MLVVPAATGVTVPVVVVVLIVAVPVLEDDQALLVAAVPDPVNAVVDPIHTVDVPLIVGNAFIVALPEATFCVVALVDAQAIFPPAPFVAPVVVLT